MTMLAASTMVRAAPVQDVWLYIKKHSSTTRPTVLVYNNMAPTLSRRLRPPPDLAPCHVFNHAKALDWFYAPQRTADQHYTALTGDPPPQDPLLKWCYLLMQFPLADAIVLGHLTSRLR